MTATGRLVVVPTPIGNLGDMTERAKETLATADAVACEDTRHTGSLLSKLGIKANRRVAVHEHNEASMADKLVDQIAGGATVALCSDAGTPAISDPGQRVVNAVLEAGLAVEVLPGPAAVIVALVASGFDTSRFVFDGFLDRKGKGRSDAIESYKTESRAVVLYESPKRVVVTLEDLRDLLGADRRVSVSRELTKLHEESFRGSLSEAVEHFEANEPRGEFVLVLEGAVAREVSDTEILAALERAAEPDMGTKELSTVVADSLGVARRRVYQLAIGPQNP